MKKQTPIVTTDVEEMRNCYTALKKTQEQILSIMCARITDQESEVSDYTRMMISEQVNASFSNVFRLVIDDIKNSVARNITKSE